MHVVEIIEHGRYLNLDRGFLVVRAEGREVGQVPIDDVSAVIVSAGCSYSNALVIALAERGVPMVLCGPRHLPVAWLLPVVGHGHQQQVVRAQLEAPESMKRKLWQVIVRMKILGQAAALAREGKESGILRGMVAQVQAGDDSNVEATAAQRYWPLALGVGFKRDRDAEGANALLNYGYTVVRAATARAVVAAGLHPSVSIKHRRDPMALVDDLMEPFRGIVDARVIELLKAGSVEVGRREREALVALLDADSAEGSLSTSIGSFVRWVASVYVEGRLSTRKAWPISVATRVVRPANQNQGGESGCERIQERPSGPRLREDAVVGVRAASGDEGEAGGDRS